MLWTLAGVNLALRNLGPLGLDKMFRTGDAIAKLGIPANRFVQAGAQRTALGATPTGAVLGLADAEGSRLVGLTTAGNGTATGTSSASAHIALPHDYVGGGALKVVVTAKNSAAALVAATVAASVKKVGIGSLGAELVTTAVQNVTLSDVEYSFTVNPATLMGGDLIVLTLTAVRNDTGGTTAGAISLGPVRLEYEAL